MSIEGKHAYRFKYLKSEEWKTVRTDALVAFSARCYICGNEDIENDVHHVFYQDSFWNTKPDDLIVLCRKCHDLIHAITALRKKDNEKGSCWLEFRALTDKLMVWKQTFITETYSIYRDISRHIVDQRCIQPRHEECPGVKAATIVARKLNKVKATSCISCKTTEGNLSIRIMPGFEKKEHLNKLFWCDSCWNEFLPLKLSKMHDVRKFWNKHQKLAKSKLTPEEVFFRSWFPTI
jgi:hypothetical protein